MNLEYTLFKEEVNPSLMSKIIEEIMLSKEIEIANELEHGQWSHVVIKGTKIPIAYIGEDNLEFVNYGDKKLEKYHNLFVNIYKNAFLNCLTTLN